MNSKMLKFMDEEINENELIRDNVYDLNPEDAPDACHACYGTGKVVVCGHCEEQTQHSHCDDTYERSCTECNGTGKIDINNVPHSKLVYKDDRNNVTINKALHPEIVTSGE